MNNSRFSLLNSFFLIVVTFLVLYFVAFRVVPELLPSKGQWFWFTKPHLPLTFSDIILLLGLAITGWAIAYLLARSVKSLILTAVIIILVIGIFFALELYLYNPWELVMYIRHSDLPYFIYAHSQQQISVLTVIGDYLPNIKNISHSALTTHPPGSMLLFLFADRIAQLISHYQPDDYLNYSLGAAWVRLFFNFIPLFGIGLLTKEVADSQSAKRAMLLLAVVPSFLFFAISPSSFEIAFVVFGLWFLIKAIKSTNLNYLAWTIGAGLIFAIATIMNFGLFSLYATVLIFLASCLYLKKIDWPKALAIFLLILLIGLGWLVFSAVFLHYNYLTGWQLSLAAHHQMIADRPYLIWLLVNLYDFAIFFGVPLVVLFIIFCREIFWQKQYPIWLMATTAILTLAVIDLIGISRGEVARIWLFLTPLFIIPISIKIEGLTNRRFLDNLLFSLMLVSVYIMDRFICVVVLPYT